MSGSGGTEVRHNWHCDRSSGSPPRSQNTASRSEHATVRHASTLVEHLPRLPESDNSLAVFSRADCLRHLALLPENSTRQQPRELSDQARQFMAGLSGAFPQLHMYRYDVVVGLHPACCGSALKIVVPCRVCCTKIEIDPRHAAAAHVATREEYSRQSFVVGLH
jgi:hypothetical protein